MFTYKSTLFEFNSLNDKHESIFGNYNRGTHKHETGKFHPFELNRKII